jgi:hypothetical protein
MRATLASQDDKPMQPHCTIIHGSFKKFSRNSLPFHPWPLGGYCQKACIGKSFLATKREALHLHVRPPSSSSSSSSSPACPSILQCSHGWLSLHTSWCAVFIMCGQGERGQVVLATFRWSGICHLPCYFPMATKL